jgi:hypothetical protein
MSTDPTTSIPDARRIAALWTGLLLAPLAFLVNLEVGYLLVRRSCLGNDRLPVHVVQIVCLLLALAGGVVAWRVWRAEGAQWPGGEAGGPAGRTRFLAGLGLLLSAQFALVILAQWIPSFMLSPCQ